MDELRVPTIALAAEIALSDGRHLQGRVFRPAVSHRHEGPPRPDEWINASAEFFPFRPDDGDHILVINKNQLAIVQVPAPAENDLDGSLPQEVVVECSVRTVTGTVFINLPEQNRRLLDFMNQPERFISVHNEGRCYLMNKSFITEIKEVR